MPTQPRRRLLLATAGWLAAPWAGARPAGRLRRVGVLCPFSPLAADPYLAVLRERLARHGLVEGRDLVIEPRYAGVMRDAGERAQAHTRQLAADGAEAILACATHLALGALAATRSLPIVFTWVADPVGAGLVQSHRQPGGNATGVTNRLFELVGEQLALLRDLQPAIRRVALLGWDFDPVLEGALVAAQPVAARLGIDLLRQPTLYGWPVAVHEAAASGAQGLLVATAFRTLELRDPSQAVVDAARERRLPVVYRDRETVGLGGLACYATDPAEDLRRAADLLARVLGGEPAARLPVDPGSDFELALNLKTASDIGLAVASALRARARQLIE